MVQVILDAVSKQVARGAQHQDGHGHSTASEPLPQKCPCTGCRRAGQRAPERTRERVALQRTNLVKREQEG